jgi:hypothetical protein
MKKLLIVLLSVLFVGTLPTFAQDCYQFVKSCDDGRREGFLYNGQSKSGMFDSGDTTEVTMIAYKGMDYRVTVCVDEQIITGEVQFRIIEKIKKPYWEEKTVTDTEEMPKLDAYGDEVYEIAKDEYGDDMYDEDGEPIEEVVMETVTSTRIVKKRKYKLKEEVRHDSKKGGPEFSFFSKMTRKMHIEVIVPGATGEDGLAAENIESGCVGLLIEHRKGSVVGFGQ